MKSFNGKSELIFQKKSSEKNGAYCIEAPLSHAEANDFFENAERDFAKKLLAKVISGSFLGDELFLQEVAYNETINSNELLFKVILNIDANNDIRVHSSSSSGLKVMAANRLTSEDILRIDYIPNGFINEFKPTNLLQWFEKNSDGTYSLKNLNKFDLGLSGQNKNQEEEQGEEFYGKHETEVVLISQIVKHDEYWKERDSPEKIKEIKKLIEDNKGKMSSENLFNKIKEIINKKSPAENIVSFLKLFGKDTFASKYAEKTHHRHDDAKSFYALFRNENTKDVFLDGLGNFLKNIGRSSIFEIR